MPAVNVSLDIARDCTTRTWTIQRFTQETGAELLRRVRPPHRLEIPEARGVIVRGSLLGFVKQRPRQGNHAYFRNQPSILADEAARLFQFDGNLFRLQAGQYMQIANELAGQHLFQRFGYNRTRSADPANDPVATSPGEAKAIRRVPA